MRPAQNGCSAIGEHRDDPGEPRVAVCCSARLSSIPVNEVMRGSPITRTTSADGRWAYTLYDGAGRDTVRSRARHAQRPRALHRPADRRGPRRSLDASPTPHRRRDTRARECPPDRGADRPEELSSKRSRGRVDVRGSSPAGRCYSPGSPVSSPFPRLPRSSSCASICEPTRARGCSRSPRESSRAPVQSGVGAPAGLFDCRG
jgi:hypothetical protein